MDWYNEAPKWAVHGDTVQMQSGPKTDFWRVTHSGVVEDSGHFYYQRQAGDFEAEVKISGDYNALYDQAGLMVRVDEAHWIKTGIEFIDNRQHVSAVVTREYSDWSVVALPDNPAVLWLRLQRRGATIEIHYALDGIHYQLLRQAYLSSAETIDVGLICATPVGEGFSATFEGFNARSLHS
jgi:regulation of enolase protein 1 (concanavalin A-like superfamily)